MERYIDVIIKINEMSNKVSCLSAQVKHANEKMMEMIEHQSSEGRRGRNGRHHP